MIRSVNIDENRKLSSQWLIYSAYFLTVLLKLLLSHSRLKIN